MQYLSAADGGDAVQLANLQVGGMNVTTDLGAAATVSVVSGRQRVASQAQAHSGHNYRADCSECACLVTCCAAPTFSRVWRAQIWQPSPLPCWNSAGLHCPGPPSLGHFVLNGEATTSCVQEAIVHGGCERFCPSRQV